MPDVLTQLKATADAAVHTPTWSLRDEDLVECLDAHEVQKLLPPGRQPRGQAEYVR
ncbi:hypothetical protein Prum_097640 [Phytohabitans rumicis]|uniref:Uncharacterized protein n=1 Tax=Phytohabitans rumicis TaxID=1076125 RepID=A0A6V8LFT0_9ACTN|nr:hypothetical protein Prum_097640 [Phytohabitans rumicis]